MMFGSYYKLELKQMNALMMLEIILASIEVTDRSFIHFDARQNQARHPGLNWIDSIPKFSLFIRHIKQMGELN